MIIIDMFGQPTKACAQFQYKGWTVSMSTVMRGKHVLAWCDYCVDGIEATTVEDVLLKIDEYKKPA